MNIRNAKFGDCKSCAELSKIEELRTATGEYISENYFKNFVDDDAMFFVAEEDNEIIGYVLGEPMKGSLANLGLITVKKQERNKGIGKKLIGSFRKRCYELGLKYVLIYAPKFNKNTLEFYKKYGFIQGKEHIQFMEIR